MSDAEKLPERTPGVAFLLAMFRQRTPTGDPVPISEAVHRRKAMLQLLLEMGMETNNAKLAGLALHMADCPCEDAIHETYKILRRHEEKTRCHMDEPMRKN